MITTNKEAESIIIKNDKFTEDIQLALGIVKSYIVKKKLILVGGMAIDYALKLKSSFLYNDDVLPDYDVYSYQHHYDAYKLAEMLMSAGLSNISVINANHTSTMRVRIYYTSIFDVTYVPKNIYEKLPTLQYKDLFIIHPHYQMIDQHRSLSLPYENSPFNTISYRWKKDATRYDMLYSLYPLNTKILKNVSNYPTNKSDDISSSENKNMIKISSIIFKDQCVGGIVGLLYWKYLAEELGFKTTIPFFTDEPKAHKKLGSIVVDETGFVYNITKYTTGITIYTDTIHKLRQLIKDYNNIKEEIIYNRLLDKLPECVRLDNKFELFDNYGYCLSAHKLENGIYLSNLQNIAMYMLCNLLLLDNSKLDVYYYSYLLIIEIVEWAANGNHSIFLPSEQTYGNANISDSYINSKRLFLEKLEEINKEDLQPKLVYNDSFVNKKVPSKYYNFDPKKSKIFRFDGCKSYEYYDRIYL